MAETEEKELETKSGEKSQAEGEGRDRGERAEGLCLTPRSAAAFT